MTRGWLVDAAAARGVERLERGAVIGLGTSTRSTAPGRRRPRPHGLGSPLGRRGHVPRRRAGPRPRGRGMAGRARRRADRVRHMELRPGARRDPGRPFEVPQILNVRHGVFVVENLDTAALAADGVREFALILTHARLARRDGRVDLTDRPRLTGASKDRRALRRDHHRHGRRRRDARPPPARPASASCCSSAAATCRGSPRTGTRRRCSSTSASLSGEHWIAKEGTRSARASSTSSAATRSSTARSCFRLRERDVAHQYGTSLRDRPGASALDVDSPRAPRSTNLIRRRRRSFSREQHVGDLALTAMAARSSVAIALIGQRLGAAGARGS